MITKSSSPAQHMGTVGRKRTGSGLLAMTAALLLTTAFVCPNEVWAQGILTSPISQSDADATPENAAPAKADDQLLLNADELVYNRDNDSITAVGSVQIYYQGNVLQADSVTFHRKEGRFVANGNVRLDQADGSVLYTDEADLTDDFADGFISALRLQSAQETRFAAESAKRTGGEKTVFEKGVYNACRYCPTERKRPTWKIKAGKIIHNQKKKTVTYRDARLEFLGVPLFYSPYFYHPDPTLRRKTGLLIPTFVFGDKIGYGARVPYFINIAPNKDVTLAATPLSEQGVLLDGQWRHKLKSGEYSISAAGISQTNPSNFAGTSGDTKFRGVVSANGSFAINQYWGWGFTATATTDRSFLSDYNRKSSISASSNSHIYLQGLKDRNYFRILTEGYLVQQEEGAAPFLNNLQERQPIVHPVLDYSVVFDKPILGGELSFDTNLTALSRGFTDLDGFGRIVGPEGNYSRTSAVAQWRRRFVDPIGQIFTPFAYLQSDAFVLNNRANNPTATFANGSTATLTNDSLAGRVMPAVGFEYRFPFINSSSWGNQIFEPIGQIIARPNEQRIGDLPNDDAQSLIFDDSTLFDLDKFSGFDRVEGGTRANIGVKYTLQLQNGAYLSTLVGRSFHLAGQNSFKETDLVSTAIGSGLDGDSSDYVTRAYLDTNTGLQFGARARIDDQDYEINRAEVQAIARLGPVIGSLTYAFVNENNEVGITQDLAEIQASGSVRITRAFRAFGALRYDLENESFVRNSIGLGYDYDDLSLSVAFSEDRSRNNSELVDRTMFVRLGLRTLGSSTFNQSVLPDEN